MVIYFDKGKDLAILDLAEYQVVYLARQSSTICRCVFRKMNQKRGNPKHQFLDLWVDHAT